MKGFCLRNGQLNVKIEVEPKVCSGAIKRGEKVSKRRGWHIVFRAAAR